MIERKRTNNDLQNTTQKTKDEATGKQIIIYSWPSKGNKTRSDIRYIKPGQSLY